MLNLNVTRVPSGSKVISNAHMLLPHVVRVEKDNGKGMDGIYSLPTEITECEDEIVVEIF